jgi:tRNA(Ile)-lysidine synthase
MRKQAMPTLPMDTTLLKPGMRLAVGVSGGADSVALLRVLHARSGELGLVLHVAHLHHGLRGAEADGDMEFVRALAAALELPFHEAQVDAAAEADKAGESIEEAARRLRYLWFRELLCAVPLDAIATAHTRDDQAETVCAKFLRGAWTEGLSGIYPVVEFPEGRVVRPLLAATRAEVEAYLQALGQGWREDSSNRQLTFTRNRIRHELLPLLEGWNPQIKEHLAQMAELAREEEASWQAELVRIAPQILLSGRPVRGGGRASGDELALDVTRLAALAPALQRRLLRYAAGQMGAAPDFPATEALRALALEGRAGQKQELAGGLRAERTPRELRLSTLAATGTLTAIPEYGTPIPGEIVAPAFGLRVRIEASSTVQEGGLVEDGVKGGGMISEEHPSGAEAPIPSIDRMYGLKPVPFVSADRTDALNLVPFIGRVATLRNWKAGDRVRLRYSGGPRKVKEVLERLRVTGSSRAIWPVLEVGGRIVWMKGVELEPEAGIAIVATDLETAGAIGMTKDSGDDTLG